MELSTSDGTGLKLKLLHSQTVLQGPLAFTEVRLTFENPENRVREGQFRITLPPGAAISRFAMRIDDKWQEAEVVERQAARRAYEDFLHRKQDPALLEKEAGNEFRARIFPIPAGGEKELILSYSQELLTSESPFTLYLAGLPTIEDLEIQVLLDRGNQNERLTVKEKSFSPPGDFQLVGLASENTVRSGNFIVTRATPNITVDATPLDDLLILFDTSASQALGHDAKVQRVKAVVDTLPGLKKLTLAAFDQEVVSLSSGSPAQTDWRKLRERQAFGATDLASALRWASNKGGHQRLLLVTDGITTAGSDLLQETLQQSPIERIDVLLVGGITDRGRMTNLVTAKGKQSGLVLDSELSVGELSQALKSSVVTGLSADIEGALWTWPTTLDSLQPGQSRLVYAKLPDTPQKSLVLKIAEERTTLDPKSFDDSPLIERAIALAQIEKWQSELSESKEADQRESLTEQIVELSVRKRVLSDLTALLVLETEQDYAQFQIDRKALTSILTVGPAGLELQNRTSVTVGQNTPPAATLTDREGLAQGDFAVATPPQADDATSSTANSTPLREPSPAAEAPQSSASQLDRGPLTERPRHAPRPISPSDEQFESSRSDGQPYLEKDGGPALTGTFAEIDKLQKQGKGEKALAKARAWQKAEPGDVLALIALGNCLESLGRKAEAARVFGSIIDLFPSRADLRRYAGSRLESLGKNALSLAVDSFEKAVEQRPDHVSSHRFLALALARQGRYAEAFEACERGLSRNYPAGRFAGYERVLKEDLGILGAAWLASSPQTKELIYARLKKYDSVLAKEPSLRFVLTWETDANDVDFHIRDGLGGHAYYSQPKLDSGGELFADVTTGYGPECFAVVGPSKAYPYQLDIHYYSRGPMGYGMGQLEILEHDGKGKLTFEERPFLIMEDSAYVSLGTVNRR